MSELAWACVAGLGALASVFALWMFRAVRIGSPLHVAR
jgi:hypothetical protein